MNRGLKVNLRLLVIFELARRPAFAYSFRMARKVPAVEVTIGQTFTFRWRVAEDFSQANPKGVPVDLTGFLTELRLSISPGLNFDGVLGVSDYSAGLTGVQDQVTVVVPNTVTELWGKGPYRFEAWMQAPGGDIKPYLNGPVCVQERLVGDF